MSLSKPDIRWDTLPVHFRHSYGTYNKARAAALKQTTQDETVGSASSGLDKRPRKRNPPQRFSPDTSSEEEEKRMPPPQKKTVKGGRLKQKKKKAVPLESSSDSGLDEEIAKNVSQILNKSTGQAKDQIDLLSIVPTIEQIGKTYNEQDIEEINLSENDGAGADACFSNVLDLSNSFTSNDAGVNAFSIAKFPETSEVHSVRVVSPSSISILSGNIGIPSNSSSSNPSVSGFRKSICIPHIPAKPVSKSTSSVPMKQGNTKKPNSEVGMSKSSNEENRSEINWSDTQTQSTSKKGEKIKKKTEIRAMHEALETLINKFEILSININKILKHLFPEEDLVSLPSNMPKTPLRTEEDFEKLEQIAANNIEFTKLLLYYFGRLEVSSHASEEMKAARWLMQTFFTNKLSRIMSWEGTKESKIALKSTELCKLLLCILKKTFPKSPLLLATGQIQRWLYTSAQRKVESSSSSDDKQQSDTF